MVFVVDYVSNTTGGPRFLLNVLNYISQHFNYKVMVITGHVSEEVRKCYGNLEFLNLNVYNGTRFLSEQPIRCLSFILKALRGILKLHAIDIIHLNSILPTLITYLSLNKIPIVASIHHLEDPANITHLSGKIVVPLVQDILELNAPYVVVHTPSKYVKSLIQQKSRRNKNNIVVIPPGINVERYLMLRRSQENGLFIMIGRLERRKHYEHAIYAFKIVHKLRPEAKLIIIGDGPLRERLQILLRELGLQGTVKILGFVSEEEKLTLLSKAEALIHLGYPEGFSIVVLEALATGVPVIAYDVPPLNETVKHGVTGMLVKKDDVAELAKVIADFHKYPFEERVLREIAKKYDISVIAQMFAKLYKSLVVT